MTHISTSGFVMSHSVAPSIPIVTVVIDTSSTCLYKYTLGALLRTYHGGAYSLTKDTTFTIHFEMPSQLATFVINFIVEFFWRKNASLWYRAHNDSFFPASGEIKSTATPSWLLLSRPDCARLYLTTPAAPLSS